MPSRIAAVLFSDPSGRRHAAVMFAGTLAFVSLYAYGGLVAGSSGGKWLLFLAVGTALSGVAESLPDDRRVGAGILRVTAILVLASLLVALVVAPALVNPR
jgi:hypothetical protein